MGRRWVVAVARVPDGCGGQQDLYCGDRRWVTGKLERLPVTISHAKKFRTMRAAVEGALQRGHRDLRPMRTWW